MWSPPCAGIGWKEGHYHHGGTASLHQQTITFLWLSSRGPLLEANDETEHRPLQSDMLQQ